MDGFQEFEQQAIKGFSGIGRLLLGWSGWQYKDAKEITGHITYSAFGPQLSMFGQKSSIFILTWPSSIANQPFSKKTKPSLRLGFCFYWNPEDALSKAGHYSFDRVRISMIWFFPDCYRRVNSFIIRALNSFICCPLFQDRLQYKDAKETRGKEFY